MQVKAFDRQRSEGALDHEQGHTEIEQARDGHIARDAAERVEEQNRLATVPLLQQRQTGRAFVTVFAFMAMIGHRPVSVVASDLEPRPFCFRHQQAVRVCVARGGLATLRLGRRSSRE